MSAIIVSGLVSGALYALVASGLSLVWGSLGVFNFAHGVLLMAGAYVAWWVSAPDGLGLGLPVGILASLTFLIVAGAIFYFLLVRPWVGKANAELAVIMTTIAGSIFMQNLVLEVFGGRFKTIDQLVEGTVTVAGTPIQAQNLLTIILAPLLLVGLWLFLTRNRTGLAIRAVAQNQDAAQLFGISVQRVYILTFAMSAVLAGVAGILLGGLFNISPDMGTDPLLRAFVVVVFGGLGSLPGTILGAYAIGLIEAFASYYIGIYWTPVVLFAVLIAVLVVRPTGLMGRPA
ncbi:branched-chain amino acid ABC transporter permease [Labrys monachus]|uniref:Branched-chain amino acid transport system permease protein n=1 Tax=Labrys monachus TaxID=217067 RepID=A0ABU0FII5_9HYPH|nr:branched-chain amino acid ABC transporter permease [Labrys monachus]MDQ0394421.1 branched-chain amino acid transport system permease protein [Labrys monachus]